jgi:hypothetical protein
MAVKEKVNKSEEVRKLRASGVTSASEIMAKLKARGIKIAPAQVYQVLAGKKGKKKGKKSKLAVQSADLAIGPIEAHHGLHLIEFREHGGFGFFLFCGFRLDVFESALHRPDGFFAFAAGFFAPGFATGPSANMSPPGSVMPRSRARRSTNWRATTSSIVLDALFSSMPCARLSSASTSWLLVLRSSATL